MSHVSAARHRTIMRASDHFVWTEATADDAFAVEWEGRASNGIRVGSGIYFLQMRAPGFEARKRLVILE